MYFWQMDLKKLKRWRPWISSAARKLDVKTVGVGGKTVTGSHGIPVTADIEEKDVTTDDMELVVLPGGMPGTLNLEKSPIVMASVRYCLDNSIYVAAICAAPSILGHIGALKGCTATCFPGLKKNWRGPSLFLPAGLRQRTHHHRQGRRGSGGLCPTHCGGALRLAEIGCDKEIHPVSELTLL